MRFVFNDSGWVSDGSLATVLPATTHFSFTNIELHITYSDLTEAQEQVYYEMK